MSRQRVIRSASRRSHGGLGPLAWLAAAAALPVVVSILVLVAGTLTVLVFGGHGFGDLAQVVAVEWLVVTRVPLVIDGVPLGFLPLLPPVLYAWILARRTRSALSDVEEVSWCEVVAAVAGTTVATALATGFALVMVHSSASDFAIREAGTVSALGWSLGVGLVGGGLGAWLHRRRALRDHLPVWAIGGVRLAAAAVAATWAIGTVALLASFAASWGSVAHALGMGRDLTGIASLAAISIGYLPNVALAAGTVALGGEAHLGEASYSLFAVAPGPLPELPLAAALPSSDPHGLAQGVLVVTAVVAVVLARFTAHWFETLGDAVKASFVGGALAAIVTAVVPAVAGGTVGSLGSVGTGGLIAAGLAFLYFGVLGALTSALSLAGLTRRRERERETLERRREAVRGPVSDAVEPTAGVDGEGDDGADDPVDDGGTAEDLDDAAQVDGVSDDGTPGNGTSGGETSGEEACEPTDEQPDPAPAPIPEAERDAPTPNGDPAEGSADDTTPSAH